MRRRVAYLCALYEAGFAPPANFNVSWSANAAVRNAVNVAVNADGRGVIRTDLATAAEWWKRLWEIYEVNRVPGGCFAPQLDTGEPREWADDDLKALLIMLTRRLDELGGALIAVASGFSTLFVINTRVQSKVLLSVISSLSCGPDALLSSTCRLAIRPYRRYSANVFAGQFLMTHFGVSRARSRIILSSFISKKRTIYFLKKKTRISRKSITDSPRRALSLIWDLFMLPQEVSSISGNILKATQNWFIAHLNNEDETRELRKYYHFCDFTDALVRFQPGHGQGFCPYEDLQQRVRCAPVQIDRFAPTAIPANGARRGL